MINLSVSANVLMDNGYWEDACDIAGINVWAVAEGLMMSDWTVTLHDDDIRKMLDRHPDFLKDLLTPLPTKD